MKFNLFLLAIIVPFLFGCEDIIPNAREFPLFKTLDVTDITESGVTLRGEIIQDGLLPTASYGFIWSVDDPLTTGVDPAQRITLGEVVSKGVFNKRVDSLFFKGISYRVRAFVSFDEQNNKDVKTVYSNIVKFKSEGSSEYAWSIFATGHNLKGYEQPYGSADNELGYITFQNGQSYSYNSEKNEVTPLVHFPINNEYNPNIIAFNAANTRYYFYNNTIYKDNAGSWSKQSTAPSDFSNLGGYVFGYFESDNFYLLGLYESCMYNLKSDKWEKKAEILDHYTDQYGVLTGASLNGKVYILAADKTIWAYDPVSDKWSVKTKFPGGSGNQKMAFAYDNKIYFGLCSPGAYDSVTNKYKSSENFWRYDPKLNLWEKMQDFPDDSSYGSFFCFFLKNNFYRGYVKSNGDYRICKFDPSKE